MQKFKTVVDSKHKFLDLKLKETFSYKDLIFLFVKRDFVTRYKQTILGPLWVIIQPLFTTLINIFIFNVMAGGEGFDFLGDKVVPAFVFTMAGTICWSYISSTISATSNTFLANAGIMGKVYYPRLVSPIATVFSHLINFAVQFAIMLVFVVIFAIMGNESISFTPRLLMLPIVMIQMMLFSIGVGLFLSAFTTKYRDLTMLIGFGMSLIGYLSPAAYGCYTFMSADLPSFLGWVKDIYMLNPISNIVLSFKYSLFGTSYFQVVHWGWYALSWAMTIVFLLLGVLLFNKTERTFMDTI